MKLYKRGAKWYADLRAEGLGRVATGVTTKDEARKVAARLARGQTTGHTLGEAMDRAWTEHYKHLKSTRDMASKMNLLAPHRGVKLETIDTPWLTRMTAELRAEGLENGTINRRLAYITKVLKLATSWGWLTGVPYCPRLKEAKGRTRILTAGEVDRVLGHLGTSDRYHWLAGLVVFLLDTGMRLGEALSIPPMDRMTALDSRKLTIWVNKGDRPRTVPLTAAAHAALSSYSWDGHTQRECQDGWQWVRDKLGLREDKGFVLHALRHTCASRLVARDIPLAVIRDYLGHANVTVTERYAHLNPRALEAAALCLEPVTESEYSAAVLALYGGETKGLQTDDDESSPCKSDGSAFGGSNPPPSTNDLPTKPRRWLKPV